MTDTAITLDLQEGFANDTVEIAVDGQAIQQLTGITTRLQIGLARSLPLALPASAAQLRVALPALGLQQTFALPNARPLWIGVSLSPARDSLDVLVQQQAFGYL